MKDRYRVLGAALITVAVLGAAGCSKKHPAPSQSTPPTTVSVPPTRPPTTPPPSTPPSTPTFTTTPVPTDSEDPSST
ncbi:hypothetical protein ACFZAM_32060 [Streptomyces sp. NPDC008079]|uniref:hypothetical protein n=1 Tax=Streptomyces sp. NPDC008079 TaxID=3364806 RepID=UPI0036E1A3CC